MLLPAISWPDAVPRKLWRCWRWRIIHQQRVNISPRQSTLGVRPHAQICHMVGNLAPSVKHAGGNEDDVTGLNLAAVSARTDHGAAARASRKEILRPRFLVSAASGR